MTFEDLINETLSLVQDNSFEESIPRYINETYFQAVVEAQMPELKRVAVVSTSTSDPYISLVDMNSAGIGKILLVLYSPNSAKKNQYNSIEDMYSDLLPRYDTVDVMYQSDTFDGIAVEGRNLWYFPVPSSPEDFTVFYIAYPQLLLLPEDVIPLDFPEHLQRQALCNGAAELCWRQIENGIDIPTPNTDRCKQQKDEGILKLKSHLGRSKSHAITSVWRV